MNIFFSGQHGFNKRRKTKKMETATTRDQLKLLYGEGTADGPSFGELTTIICLNFLL
jgi:hypothetical protein